MKAVIDSSLAHLQAWMPWAMDEPSSAADLVKRIQKFKDDFGAGSEWLFGIFSADGAEVVGGTGLHQRIGPGGLEIGYWIGQSHTRNGYATEAAAAMTGLAFTNPTIERVQIRCDPKNVASAVIPRRLGYEHIDTLRSDTVTPAGAPRDTMVWQITRAEFEQSRAEDR